MDKNLIRRYYADAGTYTVTVTNSLGSITSDPVIVQVNEITGLPKPGVIGYNLGGTVYSLSVLPDKSYVVGGLFINPSQHKNYARITSAGALTAGNWSASSPGGASTSVRSTALSRDGTKVYIGGDFTAIGSNNLRYIARFHLDGSIDSTFTPPTFNRIPRILKIAELPNGQIMIGGIIGEFGSPERNHFARLNSDGSLDQTFTISANSDVNDFVILDDGSMIVAGLFTNFGGAARSRIAKVLADGSLDPNFIPPVLSNQLLGLDIQADGKIVIGGDFLNLVGGGKTYSYLARLLPNGALDTSFPDSNRPSGTVRALHVQADNRIVAAGTGVQRMLPNGEIDPYSQRSTSGTVYSVDSTPDGCLYIGGNFSKGSSILTTTSIDLVISSAPANKTAALGSSVTFNVTYFSKTAPGFQWNKNGVPIPGQTGESLTLTGITRSNAGSYSITITNASKTLNSNPGRLIVLPEPVIVTQPEPKDLGKGSPLTLTVEAVGAGSLDYQWRLNGIPVSGATAPTYTLPSVDFANSGCYEVVVTNSLGSTTSHTAAVAVQEIAGALYGFVLQGADSFGVVAVAELPNGNIAVGGSFTSLGGISRSRFAVLDGGGNVLSLPTNFSNNAALVDLAAQPDGKVIFTAQNGWGRINADGTRDAAFPSGTDFSGACLVDGGSVYICATFPGGASGSAVRKFNLATGAEDTAFATNSKGANGVAGQFIITFVKLPNGNFACGSNAGNVAVLQPDGKPLPGFTNPVTPGSGRAIEDIIPTAGGKMFIVGTFYSQGSPAVHNAILRTNADGTIDGSFVSQAGSVIFRAGVANGDGVILFGESNITSGGKSHQGVVRLTSTGGVDPTFGPISGRNNSQDAVVDSQGRVIFVGNFSGNISRLIVVSTRPFAFTCQPALPAGLKAGEAFDLSIGWTGGGAASYRWQKNSINITGETGQSLSFESFNPTAQSGSYRVVVTTPTGVSNSESAVIAVTADPFADYLSAAGVPLGMRGENDDPDGDGVPNFIEFAYGSNPAAGGFQYGNPTA